MIKIKPIESIREAWAEIVLNIKSLGMALLIPLILIVLMPFVFLSLFYSSVDQVEVSFVWAAVLFIASLLVIPLYTLIAVSTHRLVILGKDALPNKLGMYFSSREIRFCFWAIVFLYLPHFFTGMIFHGAFSFLPNFFSGDLKEYFFENLKIFYQVTEILRQLVSIVLVSLIVALFGMVLPAIAVHGRGRLSEARSLSRGNVNAIFWSVAIPALALLGLSIVVSYSGVIQGGFQRTIYSFVYTILGVYEIAVLSVVYKKIIQ